MHNKINSQLLDESKLTLFYWNILFGEEYDNKDELGALQKLVCKIHEKFHAMTKIISEKKISYSRMIGNTISIFTL